VASHISCLDFAMHLTTFNLLVPLSIQVRNY